MKTTIKIFFISILFCAAAPSMLLSSEREERDRKRSMNRELACYAFKTDEKSCKKLLKANADPNWKNEDDTTALDIAYAKFILNENEETVTLFLLLANINVSQKQHRIIRSLLKAAPQENDPVLELFHTSKADTEYKQS